MFRKTLVVILFIFGIMVLVANGEEKQSGQAKLFAEMEKCYMTNECANSLEMTLVSKWYFPAEQGNSYGVFGFKFKRMVVKEEVAQGGKVVNNVMSPYKLYVRAYHEGDKDKEGKAKFLGFSAEIPEQEGATEEIYAFAFPAKVGNYRVIAAITDSNWTVSSVVSYDAEFPSFAVTDKIVSSSPIFLKKIFTLQATDSVFTVWKNLFHLGIGEIYPYFENRFKADEQPTLFIQLFGLSLDAETSAYKIEYDFTIKKDGEEELKFKTMQATSPGIVQPLVFKKDGKGLAAGNYLLEVSIEDKVSGKKIQKEIPFAII
jgi:hypothetical protein